MKHFCTTQLSAQTDLGAAGKCFVTGVFVLRFCLVASSQRWDLTKTAVFFFFFEQILELFALKFCWSLLPGQGTKRNSPAAS